MEGTCFDATEALNATIAALRSELAAATAPSDALAEPDECSNSAVDYNMALHTGAVFIVMAASVLGVVSVLAGKRNSALRVSPFVVALGKTAGTGIVLSCALIHMLLPSNESLASPCVPSAFNEGYPAYGYLIAMLSALAMQTIEMCSSSSSFSSSANHSKAPSLRSAADSSSDAAVAPKPLPLTDLPTADSSNAAAVDAPKPLPLAALPTSGSSLGPDACVPLAEPSSSAVVLHVHDDSASPPSGASTSFFSLVSAEFSFTVHSLFIGLAIGIVADDELKALLVALCFHQFFEGVSLGARLSESSLSLTMEVVMCLIFAMAAPIGIGAGVGLMSSGGINTSGGTFLLVQGIFDAICAGILLHIGFHMIIQDFPADVARVVRGSGKHATAKRVAMFAALWGGAGAMAFIGKYI